MGKTGITEEFGRIWEEFGENLEEIEEFGGKVGRNVEEFGRSCRILKGFVRNGGQFGRNQSPGMCWNPHSWRFLR